LQRETTWTNIFPSTFWKWLEIPAEFAASTLVPDLFSERDRAEANGFDSEL